MSNTKEKDLNEKSLSSINFKSFITVAILLCAFIALAGIISKKEGINSAKINFLTEKITVESELCEEAVLKILTESAKAFSKSIVIKK